MNFLANLARAVIVMVLALAGLAMAFVLMLSTAIALAVMYVVARVRGRPFPLADMWQARRSASWRFVRTPGAGVRPEAPEADATDTVYPSNAPRRPARSLRTDRNVTDVQARDIG